MIRHYPLSMHKPFPVKTILGTLFQTNFVKFGTWLQYLSSLKLGLFRSKLRSSRSNHGEVLRSTTEAIFSSRFSRNFLSSLKQS